MRPENHTPLNVAAPRGLRVSATPSWLLLVMAQALVCGIVFFEFIGTSKVLAYTDIGSDTYLGWVPFTMHWANYLRGGNLPGWSFNIGLGAPIVPFWDPFSLISVIAGADHVLELRIWLMIAKLMLAGWIFYGLLRRLAVEPKAAAFGALVYSFCGYAQVDAQWDTAALDLIFYPLLLLAILHRLQGGRAFWLAGTVGLTLVSNVFFVSVAVFATLAFGAALLLAEHPRQTAAVWLRRVSPPFIAGVALAGPVLLPYVLQLLDSPRVTGAQALFGDRLAELFTLNGSNLLLMQIAGLFHKNMLGIGDNSAGWWNYLEDPGFYIGAPALMLIPQLWRGSPLQRKALLWGLGFIALYFSFPAIRYLAFGFAVQYFRVSSLWVTLILVLFSAMALDGVLKQGASRRLLLVGAAFCLLVPYGLRTALPIAEEQLFWWTVFAGTTAIALFLGCTRWLPGRPLVVVIMLLVIGEASWTGYRSVNVGRLVVTPNSPTYFDLSRQAIAEIQRRDPGFYRIEKTYPSVALNDALVQDYFGTKSYAFHGSSSVRMYIGLGLIPEKDPVVNYTNWLPGFDQRFPLYSLFGVKYVLSYKPVDWPGMVDAGSLGIVNAYLNTLALPLAVLHTRQVGEEDFRRLSLIERDLLMFSAAVTERPVPSVPVAAAGELLAGVANDPFGRFYAERAQELQQTGLRLTSFGQNRLSGIVDAASNGLLVFSIPFNTGWSAQVDGKPVQTFRANLGMTALELEPGTHRIELVYRSPGLLAGLSIAALALCALLAGNFVTARRRAGRSTV